MYRIDRYDYIKEITTKKITKMKRTTLLAWNFILVSTPALVLNATLHYNETIGQYETLGEDVSISYNDGRSKYFSSRIQNFFTSVTQQGDSTFKTIDDTYGYSASTGLDKQLNYGME